MADELDTSNRFRVGVSGAHIVMLRPPRGSITKEDAINLAAWLVALADDGDKFRATLEAVENT